MKMEFSIIVTAITMLLHFAYCGALYLLQEVEFDSPAMPVRHSNIPGTRQRFLYLQDFYTMTWGQLGLSFANVAFWHLVVNGSIGGLQWIAFMVITVVSAYLFSKAGLSSWHKPNAAWWSVGKVSMCGIGLVPFLSMNMAVVILDGWHTWQTGALTGIPMWLFKVGMIICTVTTVGDIQTNFMPIQPELCLKDEIRLED